MSSDFVHLHTHSEYSLLDGLSNIPKLVQRAADLGMGSLALTDHGVLYGAVEFYQAAQKAGIKPIVGVEAYVAPGKYDDKTPEGKGYFHTVLLAKNAEGYRNLIKLTTRAHLDGYYYKPRIDRDLIAEHKEGLIISQACLSGEVNRRLTQKDATGAREAAAFYRDLMGPDHYYLELQLHPEVPELHEINQEIVRIGRELGIPLVATNDAHYVDQEDAQTHLLLRCLGFNTTVADYCAKNKLRGPEEIDASYYLQSAEQMERLMAQYPREALENTRRIADMCNLDLQFGRVQLPEFPIPPGYTASTYLRELCEQGLRRHLGDNPPHHYWDRLNYELDVIDQTGFPLYMLIVWDYVKFARSRGIPCVPRGSAGGSLVLYCLGISNVDPVANKLVFERFLNPERKEMPDIDMDFADSRRQEVLDYVTSKYGRERTAQIITFGTLGAKAALRDVGRVLNIPLSTVDAVAKLVPKLPVGTTLDQSLEKVPDLKKLYDGDIQIRDLIDKARKLEGVTRNVGTHACGVVVSAHPLDEIVPLQRTGKDEASVMASFPMGTLGEIGLLKMDMLGLTNLSIVDAALKYISETRGNPFTLDDIPLDDKDTFALLSEGLTLGVFQLESAAMVRYLKELKPTRIEDIYAMVALYRPGPMEEIPKYIEWKNNPSRITYLHPVLKPILEDTYGVIVYQEQVLQILMQMAGYTMGKADIVRKAIGKKNRQLMEQEGPRFLEGCVKNGLSREQAERLWSLIQPFAGYSFNRAHSTLYGMLSYQTAYLKTQYPTEYMAALLTAAAGNMEDVAKYVAESVRLGVAVLPPDVNKSGLGFTIEELEGELPEGVKYRRGVRFGLNAIKNVGDGPIKAIMAAREKDGLFRSLEDLADRVNRQYINKRVLESLIKCGALDGLPGTRRQKLAVLDQALAAAAEAQRSRESGQASMFDLLGSADIPAATIEVHFPGIDETPADYKEQLAWEKELLGMYISAHPVAQALAQIPSDPNRLTLSQIGEEHIGHKITLIGMLTGLRKILTKKNETMLLAQIEDLDGAIEMIAFPKVYEKYSQFWKEDAIVAIMAKVDFRRETLQLVCESVSDYTEVVAAAPVEAQPTARDFEEVAGYLDDAPPLGDSTWDALAVPPEQVATGQPHPSARSGPGHTNTGKGNGRTTEPSGDMLTSEQPSNGNGPTNVPPPAPSSTPITIMRPRQRITIAKKSEPQADRPVPSGPQYILHIHLPRTNDYVADLRCMQEVARHLQQYHGDHQVLLHLPKDDMIVLLEPMERINPTPELVAQLTDLLGEGSVEVEQAA
jgi:DNA polymerase-3 subunit alpha